MDFPAKIVDILDEWNFLTVKVGIQETGIKNDR